MPSDLTISKLQGTTTPVRTLSRDQSTIASHRKAIELSQEDLSEQFPNIHGENDLEAIRQISQQAKTMAFGAPAALVGGVTDLTSMGVATIYNLVNMAQGESFAWPENFRDVPATSDWWGARMGLTEEQTNSLAFLGGGVALAPSRALDEKLISKALKISKAFQGSRKVAIQNQEVARNLFKEGTDPDQIWKETGWFPFTDDAGETSFKFFVSDADAVIKFDNIGAIARRQFANENLQVGENTVVNTTLSEVLDHPALFELYPEIAGYPIKVKIDKVGDDAFQLAKPVDQGLASFNPIERKFELKGSTGTRDARESILHEVQHAIQAIEGWAGGASSSVFKRSVENWRAADLMKNIAKSPDEFLDWDEEMLVEAFTTAIGGTADDAKVFVRQAEKIISEGEGDVAMWSNFADRFANESRRWLSTAIHIEDDITPLLTNLSDADLETLATLRYKLDLGEMEARLTQSLADVSQETLDKLTITPHRLSRYLSGEQLKKVQREIPAARRMSGNVGFEEAVSEVSSGKIQERGLIDVQNLGVE